LLTSRGSLPAPAESWEGLFRLYGAGEIPDDFMSPADRDQGPHDRDPFAGWVE
jgi:antitoxin VapB